MTDDDNSISVFIVHSSIDRRLISAMGARSAAIESSAVGRRVPRMAAVPLLTCTVLLLLGGSAASAAKALRPPALSAFAWGNDGEKTGAVHLRRHGTAAQRSAAQRAQALRLCHSAPLHGYRSS